MRRPTSDAITGSARSAATPTSPRPCPSATTRRTGRTSTASGAGRAPPCCHRARPVLMFSRTSGTTGEPKHIPVTPRFLAAMRRGWNIWGLAALNDHRRAWLRPILQISSPLRELDSPTGVPCGAISGLLAVTQKRIVRRMYVVPPAVADIADPAAKYYVTLRCGVGRDVAFITTANPSSTIKLIETGQTPRRAADPRRGRRHVEPAGRAAGGRSPRRCASAPTAPTARRLEEGLRARRAAAAAALLEPGVPGQLDRRHAAAVPAAAARAVRRRARPRHRPAGQRGALLRAAGTTARPRAWRRSPATSWSSSRPRRPTAPRPDTLRAHEVEVGRGVLPGGQQLGGPVAVQHGRPRPRGGPAGRQPGLRVPLARAAHGQHHRREDHRAPGGRGDAPGRGGHGGRAWSGSSSRAASPRRRTTSCAWSRPTAPTPAALADGHGPGAGRAEHGVRTPSGPAGGWGRSGRSSCRPARWKQPSASRSAVAAGGANSTSTSTC